MSARTQLEVQFRRSKNQLSLLCLNKIRLTTKLINSQRSIEAIGRSLEENHRFSEMLRVRGSEFPNSLTAGSTRQISAGLLNEQHSFGSSCLCLLSFSKRQGSTLLAGIDAEKRELDNLCSQLELLGKRLEIIEHRQDECKALTRVYSEIISAEEVEQLTAVGRI